jgi:hypothetical protein
MESMQQQILVVEAELGTVVPLATVEPELLLFAIDTIKYPEES